jgi:hypothetical protein
MLMKRILLGGLLATSVIWPWIAAAGSFADAEVQLRDAYGSYRTALFQSNSGDAEATGKAMQALDAKWMALSTDWATSKPPQYEDDADLEGTLSDVAGIIRQATAEVAAGDLPKAHITLEAVRAELDKLHQRNGIISFSDRMNVYHAEMETVLEIGAGELNDDRLAEVTDAAAVLHYLARDIVAHPAPEHADAAYAPLVDDVVQSVETLRAATRSGDLAKVKEAIGGLKVPYAKLFAKFG